MSDGVGARRGGPAAPASPSAPGVPATGEEGSHALRAALQARTPARLFLGGPSGGYPTASFLTLRADHAAARDAVTRHLDPADPRLAGLVARHDPLRLSTAAPDGAAYLARPDLGRRLDPPSRQTLQRLHAGMIADGGAHEEAVAARRVTIALAGGLSATAAAAHGPAMVDLLVEGTTRRGWRAGRVLLLDRARVGVLNDIGPATGADVVVLLVGERPGLAAADSLSAYLAYRPAPGHTDAERNLVSGIHDRGTPVPQAARRVLDLVGLLLDARTSGVGVKAAGERRLAP